MMHTSAAHRPHRDQQHAALQRHFVTHRLQRLDEPQFARRPSDRDVGQVVVLIEVNLLVHAVERRNLNDEDPRSAHPFRGVDRSERPGPR